MFPTQGRGLRSFLEKHSPAPDVLIAAFEPELRVDTLHENQRLCSVDEEAECAWVVEEGQLRIVTGSAIARRGPGEVVGEMAFLRGPPGATPLRGNDVVADVRSKVWKIDRAILDGLSGDARALWYETVARALVSKLDQASQQRASQLRDLEAGDRIVRRLVCPEGVEATTAVLLSGGTEITPVKKKAVIWFSDVAGFSTYSEGLDPHNVGHVLRRLIDPQVEEIQRAHGEVDKHMGDGVMAFWLCPDQPRLHRSVALATQAALRAAARVKEVAETNDLRVGIRIGLHVGEVSVGDFGGGDRIAFTIVGPAVNSAARYEQFKPPQGQPDGKVRVSDALFDLLPDAIRAEFRPGPIEFQDKHDRRFVAFLSKI